MSKVIKFKPSERIVENCKNCMYSHYEYKSKLFFTKQTYFCLYLEVAPIDALKKSKTPIYQGDGKYTDKLVDQSYAYIENPDAILPDCPLEDYNVIMD